jgi:hypothetical protein
VTEAEKWGEGKNDCNIWPNQWPSGTGRHPHAAKRSNDFSNDRAKGASTHLYVGGTTGILYLQDI